MVSLPERCVLPSWRIAYLQHISGRWGRRCGRRGSRGGSKRMGDAIRDESRRSSGMRISPWTTIRFVYTYHRFCPCFDGIAALLLLILETHNDYIRFHGKFFVHLLVHRANAKVVICSVSVCVVDNAAALDSDTGVSSPVPFLPTNDIHRHPHCTFRVHDVSLSLPLRSSWRDCFFRFRAYVGAASQGLSRYELPGIGPMAARWVSEE